MGQLIKDIEGAWFNLLSPMYGYLYFEEYKNEDEGGECFAAIHALHGKNEPWIWWRGVWKPTDMGFEVLVGPYHFKGLARFETPKTRDTDEREYFLSQLNGWGQANMGKMGPGPDVDALNKLKGQLPPWQEEKTYWKKYPNATWCESKLFMRPIHTFDPNADPPKPMPGVPPEDQVDHNGGQLVPPQAGEHAINPSGPVPPPPPPGGGQGGPGGQPPQPPPPGGGQPGGGGQPPKDGGTPPPPGGDAGQKPAGGDQKPPSGAGDAGQGAGAGSGGAAGGQGQGGAAGGGQSGAADGKGGAAGGQAQPGKILLSQHKENRYELTIKADPWPPQQKDLTVDWGMEVTGQDGKKTTTSTLTPEQPTATVTYPDGTKPVKVTTKDHQGKSLIVDDVDFAKGALTQEPGAPQPAAGGAGGGDAGKVFKKK